MSTVSHVFCFPNCTCLHVVADLSCSHAVFNCNFCAFSIVEPTFTVQPAMANRFPQESAMFKCNATGTPTPKITWFHNGRKVTPSTTGRIQINSKNELKFTSLQSGDKGTVQCVATNDAGEAMSKALLSVKRKQKCVVIYLPSVHVA